MHVTRCVLLAAGTLLLVSCGGDERPSSGATTEPGQAQVLQACTSLSEAAQIRDDAERAVLRNRAVAASESAAQQDPKYAVFAADVSSFSSADAIVHTGTVTDAWVRSLEGVREVCAPLGVKIGNA